MTDPDYPEIVNDLIRKHPKVTMTEDDLRKKYPWVVIGSLLGEGNERTVLIRCTRKGCKTVRRTRTMSVFQVKLCKEHQRDQDEEYTTARRKRWRERRKAERQGGTHGKEEESDR